MAKITIQTRGASKVSDAFEYDDGVRSKVAQHEQMASARSKHSNPAAGVSAIKHRQAAEWGKAYLKHSLSDAAGDYAAGFDKAHHEAHSYDRASRESDFPEHRYNRFS